MNLVQSSDALGISAAPAVPRDYNFAANILKHNLDAGRGDKTAFIDHRGKYSYADLADRVERFGHVLRALGMRAEERVLICLLDTIDWPTAFLGAIKTGVVAVPLDTLMTEDDYRFMLEDSRARARLRRAVAEVQAGDVRHERSRPPRHRLVESHQATIREPARSRARVQRQRRLHQERDRQNHRCGRQD